jgi:adenosylhomocysteinase
VEIDLPALKDEATSVTANVRANVDEYQLRNGRRVYVLGQGRLVNLAAAEGHPPSVMDMSFATQALTTEYCVKNRGKLSASVHPVPVEVEQFVARHKLASMGIEIDKLTTAQERYMSGWEQGT